MNISATRSVVTVKSGSTPLMLTSIMRLVMLLLMLGAALLSVRAMTVPAVGGSLPGAAFNIGRTLDSLQVITSTPRPMGSAGLAATRNYLIAQIEALGLRPELQTVEHLQEATSLNMVAFSIANNVMVRLPGTDSTGTILLGAHYDSVSTTVGASDCGGCTAVALETLRALTEAPPLKNDVIFVWVDGEEVMRSSEAFVQMHPWASEVRAAINMEAMGASGASMIYVHGAQSGWMVREALLALPHPRAYSFVNELVWATGTGGSDLDQYLKVADMGMGFGYFGSAAVYHNALDTIESLDPQTLQHQGENVLALVSHLGNLPLDAPLPEANPTYFNLIDDFMVAYPAGLVLPLALLTVVLLIAVSALGMRKHQLSPKGILVGLPLGFAALLGTGAIAAAFWSALRLIDSRLHIFLISITYDSEGYLLVFTALTFALMSGFIVLLRRWFRVETLMIVGAAVSTLLGLLMALALPGISYIYILPALLTLLAIGWIFLAPPPKWARAAVLTIVGIGVVMISVPVLYFLVTVYGGRAELLTSAPMIPILAVVGTGPLVLLLIPQIDFVGGRRAFVPLVSFAIFIASLVIVQVGADFTEDRPKPNMVTYEYDANTNTANWMTLADTVNGRAGQSLIDPWTSQFFNGEVRESQATPWGYELFGTPNFAYRAEAPVGTIAVPELDVLSDSTSENSRILRLQLTAPADANTLEILITSPGSISAAAINGLAISDETLTRETGGWLGIMSHIIPTEGLNIELTLNPAAPVTLDVVQLSYQLPDLPGMSIQSRLGWMMAAPTFRTDSTVVHSAFTIE